MRNNYQKGKYRLRKFLWLIFVFQFQTTVYSISYFVTNEMELNNAIDLIVSGDSIVMKNGVWKDLHIDFVGEGSFEYPIVLKAETTGQVFLEGYSQVFVGGQYLVVEGLSFQNGSLTEFDKAVIEFRSKSKIESDHCRVRNCSIISYNPSDSNITYNYIGIFGTNNRVDHCQIEGKTNIGSVVVIFTDEFVDFHLIDSNYFGFRPYLGQKDAEIIRLGDSGHSLFESKTIVENNLFFKCNGEGEIISNKSSSNIFRYNTFRHCKGLLTLRHGNGSEVYGNFFIGDYKTEKQGGIRVIGENHKIYNNYFQDLKNGSSKVSGAIVLQDGTENGKLNGYAPVKNILVANNTTVNCEISIIVGGGFAKEPIVAPDNCKIVNNIFYSTRGDRTLFWYQNEPTNHTYLSNIIYGDDLGIDEFLGLDSIDPNLQLSNYGIWKISNTSPAIGNSDMSYVENLFNTDIDGQLRKSNLYDIGADEYSSLDIVYRPLSPFDVGPLTFVENEPKIETFRIYPNPAQNILFVKGEDAIKRIRIFSLQGDLVLEKEVLHKDNSISLMNIPSGVYFVLVNNEKYKMVIIK